jgi:dipeptidyl aminopeptidase/acylaminoacyl peptidase
MMTLLVRIHHGEKDSIVPISQSEEMYRALQRAGAPEVRFTRYPEAEHDSWTETYGNIDVWRWMLSKTRSATSK